MTSKLSPRLKAYRKAERQQDKAEQRCFEASQRVHLTRAAWHAELNARANVVNFGKAMVAIAEASAAGQSPEVEAARLAVLSLPTPPRSDEYRPVLAVPIDGARKPWDTEDGTSPSEIVHFAAGYDPAGDSLVVVRYTDAARPNGMRVILESADRPE